VSEEAHEIYEIMLKIDELLNGIQVKAGQVEERLPAMRDGAITAQQITRALYRMNHLMSHMGLGEDFNKALGTMQKMIFTIRMLQMSLNFLAWGTPYGYIMGAFGLATVGAAVYEAGASGYASAIAQNDMLEGYPR